MQNEFLTKMQGYANEFAKIPQVQATQVTGQTTGNDARRVAALTNQLVSPPVSPPVSPQVALPTAPLNAVPPLETLMSQAGPAPMDYQGLLHAIYAMQKNPTTPFMGGSVNPFQGVR